ncbi:hypothetical protein VA596_48215 [Amycolatopsis sp., V23-08]|uniref:Uncharacterized protein n=1 Tax=Amycolatopsis heterodermiae TaxID=3110235 RepID=A0ABU5RP66_9PSEU|nr:hypothetical protein [Amycolatopsis sp., V23-08]MEA5367389.1 hypothetical protein [Amycolatopsis sp., V23-08]
MAVDAVDALLVAPSAATRATVVIGIDGVLEARTLIDTGSSPLRATVVQDTHRLAVGAVDLLVKRPADLEQDRNCQAGQGLSTPKGADVREPT